MQLIVAGVLLEKAVQDFARRFPRLNTRSGSFGRCKFMSYELAIHLRRRGIKAQLVHLQGITAECPWMQTAHATWQAKKRAKWSHYVVVVGGQFIDMTAKQFDTNLPCPWIGKRTELREHWTTVEIDNFLERILTDVLQAQTDANRSLRGGSVHKTELPQGPVQVKSPVQAKHRR